MGEGVSCQQDQPIELLTLISRYQLPVWSLRKVELQNLLAPILNYCGAKCVLVHVGADLVTPARSKLVELIVSVVRVAIGVPSEIRQANVSDHINSFELRESLEE